MYTSTPLSPLPFSLLHHFSPTLSPSSFSLAHTPCFHSPFPSYHPLFHPLSFYHPLLFLSPCFPVTFITISSASLPLFPLLHPPPLLLFLSLLPPLFSLSFSPFSSSIYCPLFPWKLFSCICFLSFTLFCPLFYSLFQPLYS